MAEAQRERAAEPRGDVEVQTPDACKASGVATAVDRPPLREPRGEFACAAFHSGGKRRSTGAATAKPGAIAEPLLGAAPRTARRS